MMVVISVIVIFSVDQRAGLMMMVCLSLICPILLCVIHKLKAKMRMMSQRRLEIEESNMTVIELRSTGDSYVLDK